MRAITKLAPLGLVTVLSLVACGNDDSDAKAVAAKSTTSTEKTISADAASGEGATANTTSKVSANKATEAEIAAALEAAGVPSAKTWAHEVEEYRPYPSDDPTFAKLRSALAKYNPGEGVVDKIVGALTP